MPVMSPATLIEPTSSISLATRPFIARGHTLRPLVPTSALYCSRICLISSTKFLTSVLIVRDCPRQAATLLDADYAVVTL